ncbi:Thioredoxin domain-containing protein 15 [Armadillidium nasatum]|uniref:Thioredoxin domain-containing protein 15 n=1 Tax=Armadillidium nasatum TaxID=96803 RepID=A0A5N5TI04_9CRUS|nr:Thioredoxin domain-containing protein 15 [Armadillidium nasatum]
MNLIYFQNKNTSENHSNNEHILQISEKIQDDQDFVREHEIISSNNKIDSPKPLKSRRIHFKEYLTAYIRNENITQLFLSEKSIFSSHVNSSYGLVEASNLTWVNGTKSSNNTLSKKATCLEIERDEPVSDVEIVNSTTLLKLLQSNPNVTTRSTPSECYLVYFFSPYCPFSAQGSAYVNALARSVPSIPVYGLNSVEHHSLNARYSIMGTPSLVLFHNGHTVGRYNASEFSTFHLESFIHHFTNQKIYSINVTSKDFKSNLPSEALKTSCISLFIAWAFLILCGSYVFLKSEFYAKITEAVLNNWREAEAQHEHDD